jgi:hypothetical protein
MGTGPLTETEERYLRQSMCVGKRAYPRRLAMSQARGSGRDRQAYACPFPDAEHAPGMWHTGRCPSMKHFQRLARYLRFGTVESPRWPEQARSRT